MNKKLIISLGLVAAISASTVAAMAETTIYTDALGRMHFLGRDAANNTNNTSNYKNSAEQDLTRKLYEQKANQEIDDTDYSQHPVKNYLNTFPDSRFNPTKFWKTNYSNDVDDAAIKAKNAVKGSATAVRGQTDYTNAYGSTFIESKVNEANENAKQTAKKHWWNKK